MSGTTSDTLLVVGRLGKPHGVRGAIKMIPVTDNPDILTTLKEVFVGKNELQTSLYQIVDATPLQTRRGMALLTYFEKINSREQAAELQGLNVFVRASELPALDESEYFLHDLIGCDVYTDDGEFKGTVEDILETPAHPILRVVRTHASDMLIPVVDVFLKQVDVSSERIVVQLIEGMDDE